MHRSLRTREKADLLLTYLGAQDKRPEVHISLASIHPNCRKKNPLAPCMVKIEKELVRRCVSYMGRCQRQGICQFVIVEGSTFYDLTP